MKGVFALFPNLKKVRVRGCPPVAHPRRLLSSRTRSCRTPSSGCSSVTMTLAKPTTGTGVLSPPLGSHRLASRWWVGERTEEGGIWYWHRRTPCQYTRTPSAASSVTGYEVRGLVSPHPFLGATPLAVEARVVLASAVFFLCSSLWASWSGIGFFWLLGGERGACECRLLSGLPTYSDASGAGAHRTPVMDVPVIIQLKFLQYYVLDRVLQIPVVLQRRVRAVQTVQKPEIPQRSSSMVFDAPAVVR